MTEVVIFIPGIMGSVLQDGDKVIWPGTVTELMLPYPHMESLCKPDLLAPDILRQVSVSDQYRDLINALAVCGFHEGQEGRLRVLPYDWRKDNIIAAHALADLVDQVYVDFGEDVTITLLAHSMGGLISRCYLESGQFHTRNGFARVHALITFGTPHKGAPVALSAALGHVKRLWLSKDQVKSIANNPLFPSLYQLLPPQGEPFAWDRENTARLAPYDIYDRQVAEQLTLSLDNLEAARRFHDLLDLARRPGHVRYFFFAGTRVKTASSAQILTKHSGLDAVCIEQDAAGDGTVPFWSGTQSGIQTEPVSGAHATIYKGAKLKNLLGALLGKAGVLTAEGECAELSVDPLVVNPAQLFQLTIDFPIGTLVYDGEIRLRRVVTEEGPVAPNEGFVATTPISYEGPHIDHLTIVLDAPDYAGVYSVELYQHSSNSADASTTVFVQDDTGTI